jgi:RNA polymerase primary sigma factor
MAKHEAIRTSDEVDQEQRLRERHAVIREFVESKTKRTARVGAN